MQATDSANSSSSSPFREDLLPGRTILTEMELLDLYNYEIPAERLSQFGSVEQTNFKKRVYEIQIQRSISRGGKFVGSVPEEKLDYVYKKGKKKLIPLRKEAVLDCRRLLDAANRSLSEDKLRRPLEVSFWVASGYRSANDQFNKWDSNFNVRYYGETQKARENMMGGEHGENAAKHLAHYIGVRLASPGFSNHNSGRAIDFATVENGKKHISKTSPSGKLEDAWRKTWLFAWLSKNAWNFRFFENKRINEPWHWEHRPVSTLEKQVSVATTSVLPGETIYSPIDLTTRNYSDRYRLTGIYIPPSFIRRPNAKANVIVYLHGHKFGYPKATATIREYWDNNNFPLFAFREELMESRKNAILVAPTLGPKSQAGRLVEVNEGGGLDWYLRQVPESSAEKRYGK